MEANPVEDIKHNSNFNAINRLFFDKSTVLNPGQCCEKGNKSSEIIRHEETISMEKQTSFAAQSGLLLSGFP